ncbi:MAG: phasin family protein [Candidatus Competibacterales bacterium]|nr:phasin family protein [Candidatus Competibacterales bacterium]
MNTDPFSNFSQQQQQFIDSMQRFNQLAVANTEKLIACQLDFLHHCCDLGLQQLKALAEIRTPEQMQDYVQRQGEVAQRFGETMAEDTRAMAELGLAYTQQAQELARESVEAAVQPVVEEARKPAARSTKQVA